MKYKGMTVNERLYASNKMDEFYGALKNKDVSKVVDILRFVELTDKSIEAILKHEKLILEVNQESQQEHL